MKRSALLSAISIAICLLSMPARAADAEAASGFSFEARTLKQGTWLDDHNFTGFKATGNNGIMDGNGYTSDSTKSVATLDLSGFKAKTPSKIQILMDGGNNRKIELRSNGSLVCSATCGAGWIDFQNTGIKHFSGGAQTHVFEINDKGIRLTSNDTFINARRVKTDAIDQIVISGLSAYHKSHVFQVSATGASDTGEQAAAEATPAEEPKPASDETTAADRRPEAERKKDSGPDSATNRNQDSEQDTAMGKKAVTESRVLQILTE